MKNTSNDLFCVLMICAFIFLLAFVTGRIHQCRIELGIGWFQVGFKPQCFENGFGNNAD